MYNEEIKNRFISEYSSNAYTIKRLVNIFKAFAPYEEEWGVDMCAASIEQLTQVMDRIIGVRTSNRAVTVSSLRQYARWCLSNNIPGATTNLLELNDFGVSRIRERMVSSPEHLQRCLDAIFPRAEDHMYDNIFRGFMWLAFSGIPESECANITVDHVDSWARTIEYNDEVYTIYVESIPVFSHLCKSNYLMCDYVRYKKDCLRSPGNQLLRGIKSGNDMTVDVLTHSCCRKIRQARKVVPDCIQLRYGNIWLSGMFYRMYEAERSGTAPDFVEFVVKQYAGKIKPNNRRFSQVVRDCETDYSRWKIAFELQ